MSLCWSGNQDDSVILASHDMWDELATWIPSTLQAQLASGRPCLTGKMDDRKTKYTLTRGFSTPRRTKLDWRNPAPKARVCTVKIMLIFNCAPEGSFGIQYTCPRRLRSRHFFKEMRKQTSSPKDSSCGVMSSNSQDFHKISPNSSIMEKEKVKAWGWIPHFEIPNTHSTMFALQHF